MTFFEANGATWSDFEGIGIAEPDAFRSIHRRVRRGRHRDQFAASTFVIQEQEVEDIAVSPGEPATMEILDNQSQRARLARLVEQMYLDGSAQNAESPYISRTSRLAAKLLIDALPRDTTLPKLAPDGEGGIILAWATEQRKMFVTVDDARLHCVDNAGSPDAVYFDDLAFDGYLMPQPILDALLAY
ncbi:hypothetical protein LJR084_008129 [Variovorax sp. LjRoot84]|uniref:hypothetical protein n=1 Tax=Variovorax sp. LjRoot84 TaxID=3342340 RepID=UPI003ECE8FD4